MEEESSFRECRFGRISEKKEKKLVDLDCFFLEIERIPSNLLFDSTNSKFEKFFRIMTRNGAKTLESLFWLSRESIADFATILREMDNEKGGEEGNLGRNV